MIKEFKLSLQIVNAQVTLSCGAAVDVGESVTVVAGIVVVVVASVVVVEVVVDVVVEVVVEVVVAPVVVVVGGSVVAVTFAVQQSSPAQPVKQTQYGGVSLQTWR